MREREEGGGRREEGEREEGEEETILFFNRCLTLCHGSCRRGEYLEMDLCHCY